MTSDSDAGSPRSTTCLVIGAGMAGLTAARLLRTAGLGTIVLDKARGVGGRMATRRVGAGRVDHGAQLLVAWDRQFRGQLHAWRDAGLVVSWPITQSVRDFPAPIDQLASIPLRAVEGMNALARRLAEGLDLRLEQRVTHLAVEGTQWRVTTEGGNVYHAGAVLMTPPLPQALDLLETSGVVLPPESADAWRSVGYERCLTLIVELQSPSRVPHPGLALPPPGGPVRLLVDQLLKGTSETGALLTLHATHDYSERSWDAPPEGVAEEMFAAVHDLVGAGMKHWQLHRWRYSRPRGGDAGGDFGVVMEAPPLLLAGDAFGKHLIESAWTSGRRAADWLLARLVRREARR